MSRPTLRTLLRTLGLAIAALVVLALAGSLALRLYGERRLVRAESALERQGVALDLASYELPKVPEEENAAAWFQAGASAIVLSQDDRTFILASARLPGQDWSEERARRVRGLLALNRGALETLHRGATLSRSTFGIDYRKGASMRLPSESALRNAAGVLVAEGRLALRDGREDEFLLAERSVASLADAMTAEPVLIMQIVGDFVGMHALSLAAEVVTGPRPIPAILEPLEGMLSTSDRLPVLRRSFAYEAALRFSMFDAGQEFDDVLGTGHALSILNVSGYGRVIHAAFVEAAVDQQRMLEAPLESLPVWPRPTATSGWPHRWLPQMFEPVAAHVTLGARLSLAARQLVRAGIQVRATGVRDGKYPPVAPEGGDFTQPNALNGLPLRYAVGPSGSARLEIPGLAAEQLWGPHGKPLVSLDLPAPQPAKARLPSGR